MRPLSKQAEKTLIGAIERAASLVNDGVSPNDAIVKSATEANIPSGHLDLMVHAYNTGRTTKQRELGENTLEKAADFTLADIQKVREILYPQAVKTSSEIAQRSVVSGEYALPPGAFIRRHQKEASKPTLQKQAFAPSWEPPPRDEHAAAMRAHSDKIAAQRAEEEIRRQASAAYTKAAAALDSLTVYFRTPGNMAFQDAVREVELRHGAEGVSVLKKVAAVYPHIEKQAATNKNYFGNDSVYDLVGTVLSSVADYTEAQARVVTKKATDGACEKISPEIITGSVLAEAKPLELKQAAIQGYDKIHIGGGRYQPVILDRGYTPTPADRAVNLPPGMRPVGQVEEPEARPPQKSPGGKSTSSLDVIFNGFNPVTTPVRFVAEQMGMGGEGQKTDPKDKARAQFNSLSDVSQDSAVKSIRAKSVLHDLILNDPVISGHDPQDVAMAFNDISELAPNLIDTPGMLQAVLRKRLESGQLADFDVKQVLEMDKLRAERDKIQGEARRIAVENM